MSDISLPLKENGFDLDIKAGDLVTDPGLQTAVVISLFTDRRVDIDEVPEGESSRQGWWGDVIPETPGDLIGSRLWLLRREKTTVETANRAEEYCIEALQWLIDDGIVETVEVEADFNDAKHLIINIKLTQPSGTQVFKFEDKWQAEVSRERT